MDRAARQSDHPAVAAILEALVAAPGERTLEDVAQRVAAAVAEAEPASQREAWRERFADWMRSGAFLPSVPTLANAGRPEGQLAACFVLRPGDSLASIYESLSRAAGIQQGAGGTGIDFSLLRPAGSPIERSGGRSPGPIGFLELFAQSARVNRCAGRRPGAHLAVLRGDHPDILDFIRAKRLRGASLEGIGTAVALEDRWLAAAARGEPIPARDPRGGGGGSLDPAALLREIGTAIAETGEPSLLFLDTIERANATPELGRLTATNPCGEQPLLPGESCVLGSLALPRFCDAHGTLDLERLGEATRAAVRLLDDVIDVNVFPSQEIARATRRTRKIGIGVMGLADVLLLRGLPYDSHGAVELASGITAHVATQAARASAELALERGPFEAAAAGGRRNATLLAIAPTGVLHLLTRCSDGIEPFLRPVVRIEEAEPRALRWTDACVEEWVMRNAADPAAILDALEAEAPVECLDGIDPSLRRLLRRGFEIDPIRQIEVQGACQAHVDGAIAKTVHLASDAAPEAIAELVVRAHRAGCKGVSFYRHGTSPRAPIGLRPD
jgi:ribonucleoside-diphosphate reductase alpha chain